MMADLYIFWTQKKKALLTQSMLYFQLFDRTAGRVRTLRWLMSKVKAPSSGQNTTTKVLSKQEQPPTWLKSYHLYIKMTYGILQNNKPFANMSSAQVCNAVWCEAMCLNVLQSEFWPGGGAGWMLTGVGLTTGSMVVWRGWMMIVLVCRGAAAWAKGTAVISGLGWMETFGPVWIGLLIGWACLAGVCVSGDGGGKRKVRQ